MQKSKRVSRRGFVSQGAMVGGMLTPLEDEGQAAGQTPTRKAAASETPDQPIRRMTTAFHMTQLLYVAAKLRIAVALTRGAERQEILRMPTTIVVFFAWMLMAGTAAAQTPHRITVIYDAFGAPSQLERDWGFAALIEYGGRRILFDTGNNAELFARNVKRLHIDLSRLDAVVISHRHGDHTSGLSYLLSVNPNVKIYTPQEGAFFGSRIPASFLERRADLPPSLQYFGGQEPRNWQAGSPWPSANFVTVTSPIEIVPGFIVISTRSQRRGTLEMNELSLAIRTPRGLAVVVGCSHPGIDAIVSEAIKIDRRVYTVAGGLHLVGSPPAEVARIASTLHETFKIERLAPGHCTSEPGFSEFLKRFGARFDHAGVGAIVTLPE